MHLHARACVRNPVHRPAAAHGVTVVGRQTVHVGLAAYCYSCSHDQGEEECSGHLATTHLPLVHRGVHEDDALLERLKVKGGAHQDPLARLTDANAQQGQLIGLAVLARTEHIVVNLQFLSKAHLAQEEPCEGIPPAEGHERLQGAELGKMAMAEMGALMEQHVALDVIRESARQEDTASEGEGLSIVRQVDSLAHAGLAATVGMQIEQLDHHP